MLRDGMSSIDAAKMLNESHEDFLNSLSAFRTGELGLYSELQYLTKSEFECISDLYEEWNKQINEDSEINKLIKTIGEEAIRYICELSRSETKPEKGYVYILYDNESNLTKIGITKNIDARMSSLRTANINIKLYKKVLCENYSSIEKQLHSFYKDRHICREWFSVAPHDVYSKLLQICKPIIESSTNDIALIPEKTSNNLTKDGN